MRVYTRGSSSRDVMGVARDQIYVREVGGRRPSINSVANSGGEQAPDGACQEGHQVHYQFAVGRDIFEFEVR